MHPPGVECEADRLCRQIDEAVQYSSSNSKNALKIQSFRFGIQSETIGSYAIAVFYQLVWPPPGTVLTLIKLQ